MTTQEKGVELQQASFVERSDSAMCPSVLSVAAGQGTQVVGIRQALLAHGYAGHALADETIGIERRNVGRVEHGCELDELESDNIRFSAKTAHDRKSLSRRQTTRLRRSGAGDVGGLEVPAKGNSRLESQC